MCFSILGETGPMRYQRSLEIEKRLDEVLQLIETGDYSTPGLAEQVGVSIPTISRTVEALRERGHDIRSERGPNGWRYVIVAPPDESGSSEHRGQR